MIKKLLLSIVLLTSCLAFSQRFQSSTLVEGTDIEFIATKKNYSPNCATAMDVFLFTPTYRDNFELGNVNDSGYSYKVEIFSDTKGLISSSIIYPEDVDGVISGNWYRYKKKLYFSYADNSNIYAKVSLLTNSYIIINFGGYPQPPRLYSRTLNSSNGPVSPWCSSGDTGTGKPNLTFASLSIWNGTDPTYNPLAGEIPVLRKGRSFETLIQVRNSGTNASKASNIKLWVGSNSSSYPNGDAIEFGSISLSSLNQNSVRLVSYKQSIGTNYLGSFPLVAGRLYYIFIKLDESGTNDESNENDNIEKFRFRYSTITSKPDPNGDCVICPGPSAERANPYNVEIYNLSGQKLISKEVGSIKDENEIIENLPKKIYIIKSKTGSRKVYNQY